MYTRAPTIPEAARSIFSVFARKLGHESAFLGLLGRDEQAAVIKAGLKKCGVDYSQCVYTGIGETGIAAPSLSITTGYH